MPYPAVGTGLKYGDIRWAARRLAQRAMWNALPLSTHFYFARLNGRIERTLKGIPIHVRENLATAFGETLSVSEIEAIARKHVEFQARAYLTKVLPEHRQFDQDHRWPVEGLGHLDEALSRGKGAFLATAHVGYARMIGPILKAKGYEARRIVAKSLAHVEREERWRKWVMGGGFIKRRLTPSIMGLLRSDDIPAQLDIRPILTELAKNRPIMIAGDGLRAAEFEMVPLLGRPYPFAMGFMKIAMMTEAAVLPCFVVEEEVDESIRVEIGPALELEPKGDPGRNLMKFVNVLDRQIRRSPHLWYRWSIERTFEKAEQWSEDGAEDRWNRSFKR